MSDSVSLTLGDTGSRVHYLELDNGPICGTRVRRALRTYEGSPVDVTCQVCRRLEGAGRILRLDLAEETVEELRSLMRATGHSASRVLSDAVRASMDRDRGSPPIPDH